MHNFRPGRRTRAHHVLRLCAGVLLATTLTFWLVPPTAFGNDANDLQPPYGDSNTSLTPEAPVAPAPDEGEAEDTAPLSNEQDPEDYQGSDTVAGDAADASQAVPKISGGRDTAPQLDPNNAFRSGAPTFVCGRNMTYLQHRNGQISAINASGQEISIFTRKNPELSFFGSMNAFAVAPGGGYAIAVENYSAYTKEYRFWKFSLPGGWQTMPLDWRRTTETITGAAFSPVDYAYYYSYYTKSYNGDLVLNLRRIVLPESVGGQSRPRDEMVATVLTNWRNHSDIVGDIAFDSDGNLYILASSEKRDNAMFLVEREALAAASTSASREITASEITTTHINFKNAEGLAFRSDGQVHVSSANSIAALDVFNFDMVPWQPRYSHFNFDGGDRTDQSSCDSPVTLSVYKNVVARKHDADQFRLSISKNGAGSDRSTETAGNATGLQPQHVGPIPIVAGQVYRVEETLANGLALGSRYNTSYSCVAGDTVIKNGTGTVINFSAADTRNLRQVPVKCTFTNTPLGSISWQKRSDNLANTLLAGSEWTVTGTNPTRGAFTVRDCVTGGSCGGTRDTDPRPGHLKIDSLRDATYTIVEKTAPAGHEKDPTPHTVTISTENWNHNLGNITNKRFATTVRLVKKTVAGDGITPEDAAQAGWTVTAQLGGGSTSGVTLQQGAAEAAPSPQSTDAAGAAPEQLKLLFPTADATANLTVSEINQPGWVPQNVACVDNASGQLVASGDFTAANATPGEQTVALQGAIRPGKDLTCTITNSRIAASLSWQIVDAANPAQPLAGAVWLLTPKTGGAAASTVTDCVAAAAAGCAGEVDKDHREGCFKVERLTPGDYSLQETTAPEYFNAQPVPDFSISPAQLQHDLGQLTNERRRATVNARVQAYDTNGIQFQNVNMSGWHFTATKAAGVPQQVLLRLAGSTADADGVQQVTSSLGELETPWEVHLPNSVQHTELVVTSDNPPGWEVFEYSCAAPGTHSVWQPVATPNNGPVQASVQGLSDKDNLECAFKVRQQPGTLTWSKVDAAGNPLGDSVWNLQKPDGSLQEVTDCVTAGQCVDSGDTDPAPGVFRLSGLAWGEYQLTETKAPAGFVRDEQTRQFAVVGSSLHHALGQLTNQQQPGLQIPLTGGDPADFYFVSGAVLALGSLSGPYLVLRRRRRSLH